VTYSFHPQRKCWCAISLITVQHLVRARAETTNETGCVTRLCPLRDFWCFRTAWW